MNVSEVLKEFVRNTGFYHQSDLAMGETNLTKAGLLAMLREAVPDPDCFSGWSYYITACDGEVFTLPDALKEAPAG